MSIDVGRVEFDDGTVLYAVVDGTIGVAYRKLYESPGEAFSSRYGDNSAELPSEVLDEEAVAVWEWHISTNETPSFYSKASKTLRLLTGMQLRSFEAPDFESGFGSR